MTNLSFKEDHISQIPALQLLQKLGYTYLSPEEVQQLRGGRNDRVLLEPILRAQLKDLNTLQVSATQTAKFSEQNIEKGIESLRRVPIEEGYLKGNEYVYNLLTLGKALEETIQGDKRSYTLRYIDWKHPERNQFHVAEEFPVLRTGSNDHYRPDLMLFVNGIPLVVIECKRPDIKDSLQQAISQHLRNQKEDGIRSLYIYSALLIAIATSSGSYGTTGTAGKFWGKWQEQFTSTQAEQEYNHTLRQLVNTPLSIPQKEKLFAERFRYVRDYFDRMEQAPVIPCEQDRYLYNLCRPERLLELIYHFTLYDKGIKKVARYQQYAIIREVMQRILPLQTGRRKGGVIWHTQGSGKSLTMVMLAQAIASEKSIRNPRIILVTDRTDLDRQITGTFRKCEVPVVNAQSGQHLTELLESREDAVITTVINKFETAVKRIRQPLTDPNIFVLIDEGHRSQYGEMSIRMQKALPNACFIAMTGTPLMRKEKSTAKRFGGMIEPIYTVDQAVRDGAVVPLLYEGRIVPQIVHEGPIDTFFNMVCESLSEEQRIDLKRKFNRNDQLNEAEQRIFTIAWDISRHFRDNWQGKTPFKGQLVCARKRIAIKYKEFLDQIGIASSEVLITSPDDREGEETAYGETSNTEVAFWKKMMDEHGTAKKYEENIIRRYKEGDHPEIIIVVDKLLTGFDEPRNTVMYIDRKLKEHTLLQAIARVNRVHEGKQYGFIIDYCGVAEQLHEAITLYAEYDPEDMEGIYTDVSEVYAKLPQKHSELWDVFKTIANKQDLEAYAELLRMEDIRQEFYERLSAYASCLKVALSSNSFHETHTEEERDRYKKDLQMFIKLRSAVQQRYSDRIDYKKYEAQIQKLIDTHIESSEVEVIVELIDILDKKGFTEEIERITGEAARADTIASRTARHITERMDLDPAFYRKFSALLKETIEAYQQGRISAAEYLKQVTGQMESVRSHRDNDLPEAASKNATVAAYYGLCSSLFREKAGGEEGVTPEITTASALALESILCRHIFDGEIAVVDWQMKSDLIKRMRLAMEDYLVDEIRDCHRVDLTYEDIDSLIDELIVVAKARFA